MLAAGRFARLDKGDLKDVAQVMSRKFMGVALGLINYDDTRCRI